MPKEVFGSAAQYPCLLRSLDTAAEDITRRSTTFQILYPEPECKRMHDWFAKVGMPSYLSQVQGFEIPYEPILTTTKVYETIKDQLAEKVETDMLRKLIWGDEEERTFRLFKVYEVRHKCSD